MTEHELFLFLVQVAVVVAVARLGGEVALRLRIPQVVGELVFGIALGPSLFGLVWPSGFVALFPDDPTNRTLLEMMGWLGVIFLVLLSGFETRLGIIRRVGRAVATGWVGGFMLPFLAGFAFAWLIPDDLIGPNVSRPVFALFIATAMSISAIPVIARILLDLQLFKTRIGMVIMSTAVADDTVGWIVLAVVTGLVSRGAVDVTTVAVATIGTAAFLVLAFTVGQPLVRAAIRWSGRLSLPFAQTTVMLVLVLAFGAVTQALHVHLVLGCLVAGVLIARSPGRDRNSRDAIRNVGMAFFVPFFFGYTGIKVDLTTLTGAALPVAFGALAVACLGKLIGGGLGARLGGLPTWQAAAVGSGLNARGAMELVIAAIGLSIGVLTAPMYAIIVMIAVVTTLMAAPLLRFCVRRQGDPQPVERAPAPSKEEVRI
jgi:Kef-type K+ transport system membrane component KefB